MKKGFTLVELLVVVAILGVLAAVGIVSFGGYTQSSKKTATLLNHKNVIKFLETQLVKCTLGEINIGEALTVNEGGAKKTLYCPIVANIDTKFWIGHFLYENWKNPYTSSEEAVKDNCNNQIGCTQLVANNEDTFTITTYYKEDNTTKSITNDIKTD